MTISIENSQSTNTTISSSITVHNFIVPSVVNGAIFAVVYGRGSILTVNAVTYGQIGLSLVNGITYIGHNTLGVWVYYLANPPAGAADIVVNMGEQCNSLGLRVYLISGANIADLIEQTRIGAGTGSIPGDRLKLTINHWYLGGLTTFEPVNNFVKLSSLIDMDVARINDTNNNNAIMYICGNLISPSSANMDIEWTLTGDVEYVFCIVGVNDGV